MPDPGAKFGAHLYDLWRAGVPPRADARRLASAFVAAGLALAAIVVGMVALTSCHYVPPHAQAPTSPCPATPTKHTGVTGPAAAPSGGGLRVVEKGFTQVGEDGHMVSLGAVVENTSTLVAYRTRVTFRVYDAEHQIAVPPKTGQFLDFEIPVILPGQRVGVGTSPYVREAPTGFRSVVVAGFDVDLGTPQWWPRDSDVHSFAPISANVQATDRWPSDPESAGISFTVESGYCQRLTARGVVTLFRDRDGTLVGGDVDLGLSFERCAPGKSTRLLPMAVTLPPYVDDSRTETYTYCDFARADPVPAGSEGPVN
jgi:hypothetical protein